MGNEEMRKRVEEEDEEEDRIEEVKMLKDLEVNDKVVYLFEFENGMKGIAVRHGTFKHWEGYILLQNELEKDALSELIVHGEEVLYDDMGPAFLKHFNIPVELSNEYEFEKYSHLVGFSAGRYEKKDWSLYGRHFREQGTYILLGQVSSMERKKKGYGRRTYKDLDFVKKELEKLSVSVKEIL